MKLNYYTLSYHIFVVTLHHSIKYLVRIEHTIVYIPQAAMADSMLIPDKSPTTFRVARVCKS